MEAFEQRLREALGDDEYEAREAEGRVMTKDDGYVFARRLVADMRRETEAT